MKKGIHMMIWIHSFFFVWTAHFAAEWSQECHKARRGNVQTSEGQLFPVATSRHRINGWFLQNFVSLDRMLHWELIES